MSENVRRYFYLIFLIALYCGGAYGQSARFYLQKGPEVLIGSTPLSDPWTGGLNSVQASMYDLDEDGIEDLIFFDRNIAKVFTYLSRGTPGNPLYRYAPDYEAFFPQMIQGWMLMRDYNCDGKKDIFTHTNLGIRVFQNISQPGFLGWKLVKDPIYTNFGGSLTNLYVNYADIPTITDVDGDGDVDVVTYEFVSATTVELHRNMSVETYKNCDSLNYVYYTGCWGRFQQNIICQGGQTQLNKPCPGSGGVADGRIEHSGSASVMFDADGNGYKDLLVGDLSCNNIALLQNDSNNMTGHVYAINQSYPASNPVNLPSFPAAYYEDFDHDGKTDILVSPNLNDNNSNTTDFRNTVWWYKNTADTGTDFQFQQEDFIQGNTIDLGMGSHPALADIDADGDLDLLVGVIGRIYTNGFFGNFVLFENTGTPQKPVFLLKDNDYLGMLAFQYTNYRPGFADVNGDGATDLYFIGTDTLYNTSLWYLPNTNLAGQPMSFSNANIKSIVGLNIGYNDHPLFLDLNADGKTDVLIGRSQGRLTYYLNQGTNAQPNYVLKSDSAGKIKNSYYATALSIGILSDSSSNPSLVTADNTGTVSLYASFLNNLTNFTNTDTNLIVNALNGILYEHNVGQYGYIATGDLNGDKLTDIILGSFGGGLLYIQNNDTTPLALPNIPYYNRTPLFALFPNPSSEMVTIRHTEPLEVSLTDIHGKEIKRFLVPQYPGDFTLSVEGLSQGIYLVAARSKSTSETLKLQVLRDGNK